MLYSCGMPSLSPRERLTRLVHLAGDPAAGSQEELTNEVADLLLNWPQNYPAAMREPFEALLEKAICDIEPDARALLAKRFAGRNLPLSLLNALFLDATPEVKSEILSRNAASQTESPPRLIDERALLAAARAAEPDQLADVIAACFSVSGSIAAATLADTSAYNLATLCKGVCLSRAAYSALAVLTEPAASYGESYRRLTAYDAIPEAGARTLLRFWQSERPGKPVSAQAA